MIAAVGLGALLRRRWCSCWCCGWPRRDRRRWCSWPGSTPPHAPGAAGPPAPIRGTDRAARGRAGRGRGVAGPAADPPRHHLHQPAAGPGVDRPHLRAGDGPQGRRSPPAGCCSRCCCWSVVPAAVGAALPTGAPLIVAVLLAAALFFLPDLEARRRRPGGGREFRRALGAYLDLVALEMAGSGPRRRRRCRRRRGSAPGGRWR